MAEQAGNHESARARTGSPNLWAQGLIVFASVMMLVVGAFQVLVGIAALFEDDFYVTTANYVFEFNITAWGWIHLLLGIFLLFAGFAVLSGKLWGRIIGISIVAVSAVANFAFIPYYPFWSMLIIALDVSVIWALAVHGRDVVAR